MTLKEFLKPTVGKLILLLVLVIIFVPFIDFDNGIRCFTEPCPSETTGSLLIWVYTKLKVGNGHVYELHYPYFLIGIALSYIISCMLIWYTTKNKKLS